MNFPPSDNLRSPAAVARFVFATIVGLLVDLGTKVWAIDRLLISLVRLPDGSYQVDSKVYRLLPGWLHFEVTVNQGAVFGLGQGWRWLFVVVSLLAIGFLTYLFAASGRRPIYQIILGMLLAGVLGNMYDRIVYGYVRDMIHALPRSGYFPWIFNVADSLLCVGVFLMVVYSLVESTRRPPPGSGGSDIIPDDASRSTSRSAVPSSRD